MLGRLVIGLCFFLGNKLFLAEAEPEGGVQKRKRKKRKSPPQPAHAESEVTAMPPEQNGDSERAAGPERAQTPGVLVLGAAAAPSPRDLNGGGHPPSHPQSRRKRHRKRSPRVQGQSAESAVSPLKDLFQGGPSSGRAQLPAPRASPDDGAPALKRKRKLRAPLVNGSGPPTLAWPPPGQEDPPVGPADREDCPATLPPGGRLRKKKGDPGSHGLYNLSTQKAAVFKKRKKMKDMLNLNLVEHSQVLESELKLVQALVRQPGSGAGGGRSGLRTTEQSWVITLFTDK